MVEVDVPQAERRLLTALAALPEKPDENASSAPAKKRYSEQISALVAQAFAEELRERGLTGTLPSGADATGRTGAERRMAGAIGAKKVDVTWATEESGLLLGVSVKSINWRDARSHNFQKNLTNRRGDMLFEGVTLHRRFPYSVLAGFFFLDKDAASDSTDRRHSTFENAHRRLKMFSGRADPSGRDEQFERMYVVLLDASPAKLRFTLHRVGEPGTTISLDEAFDELVDLVATRNPDFYQVANGHLERAD